jgi:hypothetical protein
MPPAQTGRARTTASRPECLTRKRSQSERAVTPRPPLEANCNTGVYMPKRPDMQRLSFLATGRSWVHTWARAAADATRRLHLAQAADDNEAGLVAAHESLGAVDRLYGWARSLTKFCDEAFGAKMEEFQRRHPDLHRARNLHEHREGYLAEPRDRQADGRLSGAVAYRFTDGGSFGVELMGATGSENVDVDLTAAIADSFVLAWETTKAVDRAIDALI